MRKMTEREASLVTRDISIDGLTTLIVPPETKCPRESELVLFEDPKGTMYTVRILRPVLGRRRPSRWRRHLPHNRWIVCRVLEVRPAPVQLSLPC